MSRDGHCWCAVVGPDPVRGVVACGPTPRAAVARLLDRCELLGWSFDESWREGGSER